MMASSVYLLAYRIPRGPALLVASFAQLYSVGASPCCRLALMRLLASRSKNFLAVGCTNGIYVGIRTDSCEPPHSRLSRSLTRLRAAFRKVLDFIKPTSIVALPESNRVIVHCDTALFSYPLDLVIRVSQGVAASQELNNSSERLAQKGVLFCKAGRTANRTLGMQFVITSCQHTVIHLQVVAYATKSFVNVTLNILEPIGRDDNRIGPSYQPFGSVSLRTFPQRFIFINQYVTASARSTR